MKLSINFSCALLMLTALFFAVNSEAAVSIRGKNLDNIEDIVSTATGGRGTATLQKNSLGIVRFREHSDNQKQGTDIFIKQFNNNGSVASSYEAQAKNTYGSGQGDSGRQPAAGSFVTTKNGRVAFWVDFQHDSSAKLLRVYPNAAIVKQNSSGIELFNETHIDLNPVSVNGDNRSNSFLQSVQGGLQLPTNSDDVGNEYFAIAMLKNSQLGLRRQGAWSTATVFLVGMNVSGDNEIKLFDTGVKIEQNLQQEFAIVSVAVGDFTSSGAKDQIALVTTDCNGIYLTLYRLKRPGSNYSVDKIKEETIYNYTSAQMKLGYVRDNPNLQDAYTNWYLPFNDFPAAEVVAGDFDGDGKTEAAVVFKDDYSDIKEKKVAGRVNVTICKWNSSNGSFNKTNSNVSYNYSASYGYYELHCAGVAGLRAARADLDGDGKDEIAVFLLGYGYHSWQGNLSRFHDWNFCPYLTYWYCDEKSTTPKNNSSKTKGKGISYGALKTQESSNVLFGSSNKFSAESLSYGVFFHRAYYPYFNSIGTTQLWGLPLPLGYPYVQRTFSIVAAPFTGTIGKLKTVDDIAISWAGNSDHDYTFGINSFATEIAGGSNRTHAYLFKTNIDSNKNFSSFGDKTEIFNSNAPLSRLGLIATDFLGEAVELEAPVHLKLQGARNYAAIIQTPPYHVDYIPVPWSNDQNPYLINFTYSPSLKSTYQHDMKGSNAQDTTFDMKSSYEVIEGIGFDKTGTKVAKTAASFAIKKLTGGVGADGKEKKPLDTAILDQLVDKVDATTKEANKSARKEALTDTIETSTEDRVRYATTDVHIWRYPIREPAPSWILSEILEGNQPKTSGDKFLTFTMADSVEFFSSGSNNDEVYQPLHEEGNLFSYPTSLAQIDGYNNRQLTLAAPENIVYSPGSHTKSVSVTQEASKSKTEAKTTKYGMISNVMGQIKVMSGKAKENAMTAERGNTSAFTKTYETTDKLTASFPNPQNESTGVDYANVAFTTNFQPYTDEAGILTLAYAIRDFGSTATLWTNSIYNKLPDPSFYLPGKFSWYSTGINKGEFRARTNELQATKMRGVRFYIPAANIYTGSVLNSNVTYRIDIPIYNASFIATSTPFDVELSYVDYNNKNSTPTVIGRKSVTIGGWEAGKTTNKAIVSFDWTVPDNIPETAYKLIAKIDPDNKLEEIHKEWKQDVPGGNNTGYSKFSIAQTRKGSDINEEEYLFKSADVEITFNEYDLEKFITYAASKDEEFLVNCTVKNLSSNVIEDGLLEFIIYSGDVVLNDVVSEFIPTIYKDGPGYSFYFNAKPEIFRECTNVVVYLSIGESDFVDFEAKHIPTTTPLTPDNPDNPSTTGTVIHRGSSSGCNSGMNWSIIVLLIMIIFYTCNRSFE